MRKLILFFYITFFSIGAMAQNCAFIYKSDGTYIRVDVADTISFVAPPATGVENGYEWIDLGLSVKWATCNVGADSAHHFGNYYAWGETTPKETYTWDNYKWCTISAGDTIMTKYNYEDSYMDKLELDTEDDAASMNMGGNWRMPTKGERLELYEKCTFTWTENYNNTGVVGCIVTSNVEGYVGRSIFLPAAGMYFLNGLGNVGKGVYTWSSSRYSSGSNYDQCYNATNGPCMLKGEWKNYYSKRVCGISVRAVCK